jgi:tetratricopeptide (TPR) repeat protein
MQKVAKTATTLLIGCSIFTFSVSIKGTAARAEGEIFSTQPVVEELSVYSNKALKRRLQVDKRMAAHVLNKEYGGGTDVYATCNHAIPVHLILGRFQMFAAEQLPDEKVKEAPKKKSDLEKYQLSETRNKADQLIAGSAINNLKALDEFSAPAVPEGDGNLLDKFNQIDADLITAFDLALSNRLPQALALMQKTGAIPGNASAQVRLNNNLFCLYAMNGSLDNALSVLEKTLKAADVALNPGKYPLVYLNGALIYKAAGKLDLAASCLDKLPEESVKGRLAQHYYLTKSDLARARGDKEKATAMVAKLISLYPDNAQVLTMAGDQAMQRNDFKQALVYLKPAASLNRANPDGLIKLSQCQAKSGDLDAALKSATTAIQTFPASAEAHINMGHMHMDNKEFLGARLQFERALELKGSFAVKKAAFTPLIKVLDVMNEDKELLRLLNVWVKEFPQEPLCHYNLACALAAKKKSAEAINEYQKALELAPDYARAHYNLAILYIQQNKKDEARSELKKFMGCTLSAAEKEQGNKLMQTLI